MLTLLFLASFPEVINQVVHMPNDADLQRRAAALGFNVVNVMWEDTGRSAGSALGPNISDVTLQVRHNGAQYLLPVIRYPNFTDKTGDVRADKLWVRSGNHKKGALEVVKLSEVLGHLRKYLSHPDSLRGNDDFTAARDSHYLVSAQHVFVPIPKGGKAEFNPVIFNYQSAQGSPAVLTLLVTREGVSAAVIQQPGQPLFFNNAGQRTVFTAERKSDVAARGDAAAAQDDGADMMMLVQVPLKHKNRGYLSGLGAADMAPPAASKGAMVMERKRGGSDVETAVIGHGDDLGPVAEMEHLSLERDPTFPVRVTVQFYRATSNGVVSQDDLADVKRLVDRVYADADYVGSLVVGSQARPTSWIKRWGILQVAN